MQEKELVTRKISAAEGADLDDDEFYQVESEEVKDKKNLGRYSPANYSCSIS